MNSFFGDLRYGARLLARSPGFTFVAVAALAFGIGANVTIFGFANALLLKPLPIAEPDRVIRAYSGTESNTNYAHYQEYRDRNSTLSELAAFQGVSVSLRAEGPPQQLMGQSVTGNYFTALGVAAQLGRVIESNDDQPGAPGVVVLGHGFWRRHFGGDPQVIGRAVMLDGHPYTIVGVAPASFLGAMAPMAPELWVPWNAPGQDQDRAAHLIGRLRPGASITQAQADLSTIAARITAAQPDPNYRATITVYPARTLVQFFVPATTAFLGLLMAVVGLVLLIACVNIASLLLARSAARRREIAIRLSLGADRKRLTRQLLTESLLLSITGGAAATAIAFVTTRVIASWPLPAPIPIAIDLAFDWRVGLFAAALSIGTTILFGLTPALQSAKTDVAPALKEGTATAGVGRSRLRAAFVITQVALSTLLLVMAGVLVHSMVRASDIDVGFVRDRVLTASIALHPESYTPERGGLFYEQLLDRLERNPGILAANVVDIVPLTLSDSAEIFFPEGQEAPPAERFNEIETVHLNRISRGHFRTLDIPLLAGRDFDSRDRIGSAPVAIVNETLARRFWPGESPIGKRLHSWNGQQFDPWIEVVGLARESKYQTVGENPKSFLYRPIAQLHTPRQGGFSSRGTILIKASGNPMAALPALQAEVEALDPNLPVFNVMTLEAATSVSLLPIQVAATLAGILGLVALALAAIGIYGAISYLVRQRTREIGIRMALGARPGAVVRLVTQQGMIWTISGMTLGLSAALAATQLLSGLLYGIAAADPLAFGGIPLLLGGTAFAACYVPARRASRIDPLAALREQ